MKIIGSICGVSSSASVANFAFSLMTFAVFKIMSSRLVSYLDKYSIFLRLLVCFKLLSFTDSSLLYCLNMVFLETPAAALVTSAATFLVNFDIEKVLSMFYG